MSGTLFRSQLGSRKRPISQESFYEDPEISFHFAPQAKKRRFQVNHEIENNDPNCETVKSNNNDCEIVDEDISFRKTKDLEFQLSTNFNDRATVDQEISFRISSNTSVPEDVEPRRSPNGYILPDPLPEGLVITDLSLGRWKIGRSVGLGGFGEVYSATLLNEQHLQRHAENFVIKVEPHTNGPLFMEINFYIRAAKLEMIEEYKAKKNLEHLGIPHFVASGSFIFRGKKLRFLVMPRFGTDLQAILDASKNVLSISTACSIAVQVINSYEYLHSKGYVHKDLKGSNLLFSLRGPSDGKVFLVDYGLVSKLTRSGLPMPNIPDSKSAHEGTLEFCSRDAHRGCISRRGDFEVLLFSAIDWLGGKLPWDQDPQLKPRLIEEMKNEAFQNIHEFLTQTFNSSTYPGFLLTLMQSISDLTFEDVPDYDLFRSIFTQNSTTLLNPFSSDDEEEVVLSLKMEAPKKGRPSLPPKTQRKRAKKVPIKRKGLRNQKACSKSEDDDLEVALSPDAAYERAKRDLERIQGVESLKNPTPAMIIQMERMAARKLSPKAGSPVTDARRKMGKKRRRRGGSGNIRPRRKSIDCDSFKSEPGTSTGTPKSPRRSAFSSPRPIRRDLEKSVSIRKRFENVVGDDVSK